jgi:hypothetical protein
MTNPFRRRESWSIWLIAVLAGVVLATLLLLFLSKAGYSNRPDVERAMEAPPQDEPAPPAVEGEAAADTSSPASGAAAAPPRPPTDTEHAPLPAGLPPVRR